jgi:hypothetical protein
MALLAKYRELTEKILTDTNKTRMKFWSVDVDVPINRSATDELSVDKTINLKQNGKGNKTKNQKNGGK